MSDTIHILQFRSLGCWKNLMAFTHYGRARQEMTSKEDAGSYSILSLPLNTAEPIPSQIPLIISRLKEMEGTLKDLDLIYEWSQIDQLIHTLRKRQAE